jgi:hypothetical protein
LHALNIIAQAFPQNADAIDHCIDAVQQRQPPLGLRKLVEIGSDPLRIGQSAPRAGDFSSCPDHLMIAGMKPRQAGRPDQAISAVTSARMARSPEGFAGRPGAQCRSQALAQKLDPAFIEVVTRGP